MSSKQKVSKQDFKSLDITELILVRDNLLVKALRPEPKANQPIDPAQYEDKPEFGLIINVGDEVSKFMKDDIIRFGKYSTENIRSNGEDYFIVREEDCSGYFPR